MHKIIVWFLDKRAPKLILSKGEPKDALNFVWLVASAVISTAGLLTLKTANADNKLYFLAIATMTPVWTPSHIIQTDSTWKNKT